MASVGRSSPPGCRKRHRNSVKRCSNSVSCCRPSPPVCRRINNVILIQWIAAHKHKPYPSNSEKVVLARLSKKTLKQLNDYFANARREIKKTTMERWLEKHPVPHLSSLAVFEMDSIDVSSIGDSNSFTDLSSTSISSSSMYTEGNLIEPTLSCSVRDADQSIHTKLPHSERKDQYVQDEIKNESAQIYNSHNLYVSYQPYTGQQHHNLSSPNAYYPAEQNYISGGYGHNSFGAMPTYSSPSFQDSFCSPQYSLPPTPPLQPLPSAEGHIDQPPGAAALSGYQPPHHAFPYSQVDVNCNVCVQWSGGMSSEPLPSSCRSYENGNYKQGSGIELSLAWKP